MTKEEYILLYEKYHSGNCSHQEKQLFESYSDDFILGDAEWDLIELGDKQAVVDKMYAQLQSHIHPERKSGWILWARLSAAAVVLAILASGIYYFNSNSAARVSSKDLIVKTNDVGPGTKKAILTLHDGSTVILDESKNGLVASQGKTLISKTKGGQIIYRTNVADQNQNSPEIYNSIRTPRGGESQLLLPDGTKVWLNSESVIRFPTIFSGNERRVELRGEAYLEVAENKKMPFKISVKGTEVEVLGTHFNVSAYGDKPEVNTTLLQGSVKISKDGHEAMLKPGQSGVTASNGTISVRNVNAADAIAWKNGYFVYQNEDIYSIMEKAARWYDVEVQYQGDMKDTEFYGRGHRYENISELLKNLELAGKVHFKVQGRRVVVMSK